MLWPWTQPTPRTPALAKFHLANAANGAAAPDPATSVALAAAAQQAQAASAGFEAHCHNEALAALMPSLAAMAAAGHNGLGAFGLTGGGNAAPHVAPGYGEGQGAEMARLRAILGKLSMDTGVPINTRTAQVRPGSLILASACLNLSS